MTEVLAEDVFVVDDNEQQDALYDVKRIDQPNMERMEAPPMPELQRFSFPLRGSSDNIVLDASQPLLALVLRIWDLKEFDFIDSLHKQISVELESIELELHKHGYDRVNILAHRYCLCSVIDEAIMCSPWGQDSNWSERSLLATFHNETWGGEKFFVVLDRLMMEPARYIHIIEFMYVCMCIGFEGKYRVRNNGKQELEDIIREVHRVLRENRGDRPELLTDYSANLKSKSHSIKKQTPLGLIFLVFLIIIACIYFYFYSESVVSMDLTVEKLKNILSDG